MKVGDEVRGSAWVVAALPKSDATTEILISTWDLCPHLRMKISEKVLQEVQIARLCVGSAV